MDNQTTLSDALIEAGLEAGAARRWARAIEQEQGAAALPPTVAPKRRLDRFLERGLPFLFAFICLEAIGVFTMLGYLIGRVWGS